MRGLPFVRGDKWQFLWDKGGSFTRGHLSGGSNGGSRIKPGFSYHLSLLKSQVIGGTSGPGRTSGLPIEDKKRTTMAQTRGSTGGFPVVRVCKNKKKRTRMGYTYPPIPREGRGSTGVFHTCTRLDFQQGQRPRM